MVAYGPAAAKLKTLTIGRFGIGGGESVQDASG
ncbi:hypothetical protein BN1049_01507 [Pseudomonas saudimassiliensis]|uniref:Uncharacterized protein n=1 Tax=Pseudomonas saudimassiliensis TaxID=1461581 RepID=A0A078MAD8_9PSED|nr:hypothetical protein BN1049_01507 [Pseudomonas saudimassiliensis]CEF26574.1 hypothetical protein BN1049_01507 [Pseudomonas saudimassiliensis]